ncbi:hypothetical protein [Xenophilus sp. Marseille-Q4582]|uniref:hypothetical protein n=1 Tax=Xenophilus sp. Marseille-Q4582 TaxID=2866600 RepID=UPI001CE4154A|nr:hypothetical protein [Xenophilus sp. Marseille-Q4582]
MPVHLTTTPVLTPQGRIRTLQIYRRTYPRLRPRHCAVDEELVLDGARVEPLGGNGFRVVATGEVLRRLAPGPAAR